MHRPRRSIPLILVLLAACGDGLSLPNEGQPSRLTVVRGDGQSGTIGEPLGDSLVVRVTDRFDDPVGGVQVAWTAEVGGSVDPGTSVTSPDGYAGTQRILGPDVGTYVTRAEVMGVDAGPDPVIFTTTGVAARLTFTVPAPATATSGVPFDPQPVLQLQDAAGDDIARGGVVVTVQISSGGGTLAGTTTATSDAAGQVGFTDLGVRGSPGTRTLIFAAEGFASATARVALGVGAPASIAAVAGDGQSAVVATEVAVRPAVVVRDADGNPLAGIPVVFEVTGGGGSATDRNPVTGSDGVATVGSWTLGQKAGANTLEATLSGLEVSGSPVVFSAAGTPGPVDAGQSRVTAAPASITASSGPSAIASTITVTARDAFQNPIPGLTVILSATGNGNTLTQPSLPTGSDGTTTGRLSSTLPGDKVVSAEIAGTAVTQTATVQVSPGAPVAAQSSATVPNGTAGEATVVQIQLRDAQGNPVTGRRDAIAVSVSGANSVSSAPVADQGGGNYTASYTPQKSGTDKVQVRVSGTPVPRSPFTSTVQPGPVDAAHSEVVVPACVEYLDLPVVVRITAFDALGNQLDRGGTPFEVRANGTKLGLTDNSNGTYVATFNLGSNLFRVDATLNGTAIKGSPAQVLVPFVFSTCP